MKLGFTSMMFVILIGFGFSFAQAVQVPDLYTKAYGDASKTPIVFIHGGPGYDSQDFEYTTAQALADAGFYVVVYDQRGQGRSSIATTPAIYTYKAYADDLKLIIDAFQLKSPILMGHSHGGAIAMKFEEYYPGVAKSILLVSAPVDFFASLQSIFENCSARYTAKNDTVDLQSLQTSFNVISTKDSTLVDQIQSTSDVFGQAMKCGLYVPAVSTPAAQGLYQIFYKNYVQAPQENQIYPMGNFMYYENFTHLDETANVQANAAKIFGIYGDEDGLFTPAVLTQIESDLSANPNPKRFQLIKGASHNVFIDQQVEFINDVKAIAN